MLPGGVSYDDDKVEARELLDGLVESGHVVRVEVEEGSRPTALSSAMAKLIAADREDREAKAVSTDGAAAAAKAATEALAGVRSRVTLAERERGARWPAPPASRSQWPNPRAQASRGKP